MTSRIRFRPTGNLVVYSDTDYTSDREDRKSITIAIGLIRGGLVFWGSRKQTAVSTTIIEAEYIAIAFTNKQG